MPADSINSTRSGRGYSGLLVRFDHIASRIDNLVSECEHQDDDFG